MLQFKILSGKKAGADWCWENSRFPIQVGRANSADLSLDDPGVWEKHFEINLEFPDHLTLKTQPDALVTVNGQKVEQTILRNGDLIEIGSVKMRFGFSPVRQRSLRPREILTWIAFTALCLGQVALIYRLIR